jgi:hypothetical protein
MKLLPEHQHIPFGPYLTKMKADPDFCRRLLEVGKTLTRNHTEFLAGNLEHEYLYDLKKHPWIEEELKIYVNTWIDGFKQFSGNKNFNPTHKQSEIWINFQKSKEYNPIHTHPNCNISFILFLEIPKEMLEEKQITRGAPPGWTGFLCGEDAPAFITHRGIKPETNLLLMFPSNLRHYVAHFNSKVTRTSVSGNIVFSQ